MAICCVVAVLALSNIYIPKTSAAESYFTAEGGTLELDKIDPSEPDQRLVDVRLKATREMTIHSMHGYFTPISDEDEELQHYMSWMDYSSGISHLCYSTSTGEFDWNISGCIDDVVGDEGIHVQAGDTLIYATFEVKDDVEVMKRSMPVTLDLAVIDEGTETGKQIRGITMDSYVRVGHELSVYKYIMGNGDLDVPNIVIGGTDVEVGIVPEPGNELVYLELDGQEVTDQIQDNVFKVIPGTESLTFYATFLRVYPVLEGDGGEHVVGSEEPLVFKIDDDDDALMYLCDRGNLLIDDEYLNMRANCEVDLENQTITLSADFLNTLELGEHAFGAYFSEPDPGFTKAKFKIIEKIDDNEDDDHAADGPENGNDGDGSDSDNGNEGGKINQGEHDGEHEDESEAGDYSAPNTGSFTGDSGNVSIVDNIAPLTLVIGAIAVAVAMKRVKRK